MRIFLLFLLLLPASALLAQEKDTTDLLNFEPVIRNKIYYGGGLSVQFGTYTLIDVSPMVGVKVTDNFHAGIGARYQYSKHKSDASGVSIYGGSLFSRYFVMEDMFLHGEYEYLTYRLSKADSRINLNSLLLGGGYRQWISDSAAMSFMVLWNFSDSDKLLYSNPVVRVGVEVGL